MQSTKNKDYSPENLMLIRSKEVLIPPENFSVDKSRPSSLKINKTTSQNCYKRQYPKKVQFPKNNNSSLGKKSKNLKTSSFLQSNFMTLSGVNNKGLIKKGKIMRKGRLGKLKKTVSHRKSKKTSDIWEDFVVKNVKTKIKKLNILKREKGNNYSISINNNNFNNNINLINSGNLKENKQNHQNTISKSPKLKPKFYRLTNKGKQIIRKKGGRKSNSQNLNKFQSQKSGTSKQKKKTRKMQSLKDKRTVNRGFQKNHFKSQKIQNKQKILLDLASKNTLLNSASRLNSSRANHKKFNKNKQVSNVLQKITKKANLKNLALNLPLHPKIPKLLNFNKPMLNMDKSKYLLDAGYLNKGVKISLIKSERQQMNINGESLHCKKIKKKVKSQCANTSRRLKESRTWLASDDKISSHSKSLLRIKKKLKKKRLL